MKQRKILEVFSIIYKGRQRVGFKVEGIPNYIFLSPKNVTQCTNVGITEVEILTGSKIRPEFYKIGEKMFNGVICNTELTHIKDFWIECSESIENMRISNADKLKKYKQIVKVFYFYKNDKYTVGFDIGSEKTIFVPANRIKSLVKLELSEIHILEGSYIAPEYFQEGENIYPELKRDPVICKKSNVILKNLNLRLFGNIEDMHERYEKTGPIYSSRKYDRNREDYDSDYYSDNWLENAAGTDDPEVMNDTYWNMD